MCRFPADYQRPWFPLLICLFMGTGIIVIFPLALMSAILLSLLAVFILILFPRLPVYVLPFTTVVWLPLIRAEAGIVGNITLLDLTIVALVVAVFIRVFQERSRWGHISSTTLPMLAFALLPGVFPTIPSLLANDFVGAFYNLAAYGKTFGEFAFIPVAILMLFGNSVTKLMTAWGAAILTVSTLAVAQSFGLWSPDVLYYAYTDRSASLLGNPNILAMFLVTSMNLTLFQVSRLKNPVERSAWLVLGAIQIVALLASGSRGAILGCAVLLCAWLALGQGRSSRKLVVALGACFLILALYTITPDLVTVPFGRLALLSQVTSDENVVGRLTMMQVVLRIAALGGEGLVFGWGPTNFAAALNANPTIAGSAPIGLFTSDNQLLDSLIKFGLLGLIAELAFLAYLFIYLPGRSCVFQFSATDKGPLRLLLLTIFCLGSSYSLLSNPQTSSLLFSLVGIVFWHNLGMIRKGDETSRTVRGFSRAHQ